MATQATGGAGLQSAGQPALGKGPDRVSLVMRPLRPTEQKGAPGAWPTEGAREWAGLTRGCAEECLRAVEAPVNRCPVLDG